MWNRKGTGRDEKVLVRYFQHIQMRHLTSILKANLSVAVQPNLCRLQDLIPLAAYIYALKRVPSEEASSKGVEAS